MSAPTEAPASTAARRLRSFLKFLGFLSIGVVILALVYRSQSATYEAQCALDGIPADECSLLDKLAGDLSTVRYGYLALLLAIFMASNVFRALRWQQLIEPLGKRVRFGNALWAIMIGYLANLGFPRAGEVVRAGLLGRYEGVAIEKVMGTVVVDRLLDLLCLGVVVAAALFTQWDTLGEAILNLRGEGASARASSWRPIAIVAAVALLVGLGLYFLYTRLGHTALVKKVAGLAGGFADGMRSLTRVRNLPMLVLHTVGIWGSYFLMAYVPFLAFPPTELLGWDAALTIFVFSALGIIIPAPGGMGSYHFMVIQALALYNVPGDDALSFANILFLTVNLGCNLIFGVIGLVLLPILNGGKEVDVEL